MILEMKDIVKTYGNVIANNKVSLSLNEGEILAIVGENGAGKSTIMKVLYGLEKADSGEITVKGKRVSFQSPFEAIHSGIGMVQQHFMLFGPMTVTENIVYNHEIANHGFLDLKKCNEEVRKLSERYGLKVDPTAIVNDLPVGTQQRVEILKTLYQNVDIIIFDEPSAVLTPHEVDELLDTMKGLAKAGKSLIIITHKLNEVMNVADRIVIMRAGEVVGERKKEETSIEELSYLMIGRRLANTDLETVTPGETLLKTEHLKLGSMSGKLSLNDVNLEVKAGEIVGIAGVSGNGQTELAGCISGLIHGYEGKIFICGKDVTNQSVNTIRKAGLSFVPEDRYKTGSAKEANLTDNSLMADEDEPDFSTHGILKKKAVKVHANDLIQQYKVKVDNSGQKMKELSGGNAQKIICARELERKTPFVICAEPTRGVDIGAMEFIHNKMIEKKKNNGGILLISSELSEIMKLSDRIYVMYEGHLNYEFKNGEVDDHKLGKLMLGGSIDE